MRQSVSGSCHNGARTILFFNESPAKFHATAALPYLSAELFRQNAEEVGRGLEYDATEASMPGHDIRQPYRSCVIQMESSDLSGPAPIRSGSSNSSTSDVSSEAEKLCTNGDESQLHDGLETADNQTTSAKQAQVPLGPSILNNI